MTSTSTSTATSTSADPVADPTADVAYQRWLLRGLDTAERSAVATSAAWAAWARQVLALRRRMPCLPGLPDPELLEPSAVGGVPGFSTDTDPFATAVLSAGFDRAVIAADHYAAVYARHAELLAEALADALEDTYPPLDEIRAAGRDEEVSR